METNGKVDEARLEALGQLKDQLLAAMTLAERLEEFLTAAQIAIALATVQRALPGLADSLPEPRKVGVRAG